MEPSVERTLEVPLPPEEVWPELEAPDAWLDDPEEPERVRRVDAVEPGRRVDITWWPADDPDAATSVTFTVEPQGDGGSIVRIVERRAEAAVHRGFGFLSAA
jgi:uncharacterized protein YndB with AHSA1/START domain